MNADDTARGKTIIESGKYAPPPLNGEQPHTETPSGESDSEHHTSDGQQSSSGLLIYPPPTAPFAVAKQLYQGCRDADGVRNLLAYRGDWQLWRTTHWSEIDAAAVRARMYRALEHAYYIQVVNGVPELRPWEPTRHKVANVLEAMAAIGYLSSDIDAPDWIETVHSAKSSAAQMISCQNGLLDLGSRTLYDHTPALFNFVSAPFDYDPDAPEPTAWLGFLKSVWGDDRDSIALLQEYFGYVLSGRLDMQKMLLLVGPIRGGKGTMARMLTALMGGRRNVPGPTLAAMNTNFGLSPLNRKGRCRQTWRT
jgi:putative DNA primase/helicase